ncbi:MAG: flagellar biosynthetic protein FliO [Desulfovibrionaceae bacterium]|nr:flagellar biosynthetic protein FliO [Desulfovibrionaceae bacterium]
MEQRQETLQPPPPELPEYSLAGYFTGLSVLFLLLGICWFALRYLKNRGALRLFGQPPGLEVEGRLNLGPKKSLLVLRYYDKRLLLGVTDQRISLLDSSPNPAAEEASPDGFEDRAWGKGALAEAPADNGKFRELLHGRMRKK